MKARFGFIDPGAIMGVVVWTVTLYIIPSKDITTYGLFFGLMGSIITGIVLYGAFSFLMKSQEFYEVLEVAKKGMEIK